MEDYSSSIKLLQDILNNSNSISEKAFELSSNSTSKFSDDDNSIIENF